MSVNSPTPSTVSSPAYQQLLEHTREASLLGSTGSLLGWDLETTMPTGGGAVAYRSSQLALLARLTHARNTDPRIADWLAACESDPAVIGDPLSVSAVNVREIRRDYDRATKLPPALVEEVTRTTSIARHEWALARKDSDFARFRPWLEKIVSLCQEQARCFGWDAVAGEPWDALAEGYEPGCNARQVEQVFTPLRQRLAPLIAEFAASPVKPADRVAGRAAPIDTQQRFVRHVCAAIGFDFSRGRLDVSTHPFCGGTHRDDVRLTTRYRDDHMLDALGSAMHESGHGIYNQNVPDGPHIGTPMGEAIGLSIHESQSRLWENQVGRSRAFWTWCAPHVHTHFGPAAQGLTPEDFYTACNTVEPGLIRVDADEATYNLHIMIRFELERALIRGDLPVADLPAEWNRRYREYLGLDVPNDRQGCLQDIHWSLGAIGYFPTYTLGNLYAAQFFEQAQRDMPDLAARLAEGRFSDLKDWLTRSIHSHGKRYSSEALCMHVTGSPLSAEPFLRYLEGKLRPLYRA